MYRILVNKETGKEIPGYMQSGGLVDRRPQGAKESDADYEKYNAECDALEAARLNTVLQNGISAGLNPDEIEAKYITDAEWDAIQVSQITPMVIWKQQMAATDADMPRWAEDIWDVIGVDTAPVVVRDRLAAKKALRAERPQ